MNRLLQWILSLSLGVSIGIGTYVWLVADPLFVGVIVLFWTLGTGFSIDYLVPQTGRSDDWETARWSGAAGGLMALAATLGISPTLPISADLRLALGLFVVGSWLTAVNVGLALGLEAGAREWIGGGR
ncbi:hypothetical protein [Halorhabdus amylolytica]|uniref:hypothetical protein n=1 Tax=Halorhabdus amylolytica TaxID=2559573 RepID=UPI0010AB3560|nr:hypothetical protein [Halorhabdus amylolytica]